MAATRQPESPPPDTARTAPTTAPVSNDASRSQTINDIEWPIGPDKNE
jgi:hypothetical protein